MCWGWVGKGFFFILESPCFVETTSLILAVGNLTVPLSHRIRVGKCEPRGGREEINKSFSSQFVSILSVHSRNVPVRLCNSLLKIKSPCANPTNPLEEPFCPQWFYSSVSTSILQRQQQLSNLIQYQAELKNVQQLRQSYYQESHCLVCLSESFSPS